MERLLETLFRYKWLLLVLLFATWASGASYVFLQRTQLFQAQATIWAERPAYLTTVTQDNQWVSAAGNEAGKVNELLQTQTFDEQVLQQTAFRDQLQTEKNRTAAIKNLKKRLSVYASSDHVVVIVAADEKPNVAVELVNAVITSSSKETLKLFTSDSSAALAFYQQQLDAANGKLTDATGSLQSYLNAHPELTAPIQGKTETALSPAIFDAAFAAQHPELIQLIQQRDSAQKDAQTLQTQVLQIRFAQSSYSTSSNQSFRVIDQPSVPESLVDSKKTLATRLGMVMAAGLVLMGATLALLTLMDTTLRSERIAAQRLGLPIVSTLPYIRERRGLFRRSVIKQRSVRALLTIDAQTPRLSEMASREQSQRRSA